MSVENPVTILCFGDSNTYGSKPDGTGRYDQQTRWTGQLQAKLGPEYRVIEEGLDGRSTNLEHPRPDKQNRHGFRFFTRWLMSHRPVDAAVIMLGTGDHRNVHDRPAKETAESLRDYCRFLRVKRPDTKTILVAPAFIRAKERAIYYDATAEQKSHDLVAALGKVAANEGVGFYDANEVASVGPDGLHWTEASQEPFASAIAERVRQFA